MAGESGFYALLMQKVLKNEKNVKNNVTK